MTEKCSRYEDAHPCDRWKLADGKSCWMTGQDCDVCGMPLATDGKAEWCTAGGSDEHSTEGANDQVQP